MKNVQKFFLSRRNIFSLFDSVIRTVKLSNEVINLQTNDTLMLSDLKFANAKEITIVETEIMTKS
jgi:hypothetical protein